MLNQYLLDFYVYAVESGRLTEAFVPMPYRVEVVRVLGNE